MQLHFTLFHVIISIWPRWAISEINISIRMHAMNAALSSGRRLVRGSACDGVQSWRQSMTSLYGFLATAAEIPARARWNLELHVYATAGVLRGWEWGPSARAQCELNLPPLHIHPHRSPPFLDGVARPSLSSPQFVDPSPRTTLPSVSVHCVAANSRERDCVVTSRWRAGEGRKGDDGTGKYMCRLILACVAHRWQTQFDYIVIYIMAHPFLLFI